MPQNTMKGIIGSLKTLLGNNSGQGNTLSKIKQVKRGVLPLRYILPVISIMPDFERTVERRAGRQVIVERGVDVFLIDKDYRGRPGIQELQTLASQTREILINNYLLPDGSGNPTVTQANFGNIEYSVSEADRDLLHIARIPIVYRNDEQLPNSTTRTTFNDNPTARTVSQVVYDDLYAQRAGTLSAVKQFFNDQWGPFSKYPLLVVSPLGAEVETRYAGRDLINREIEIDIMTRIRNSNDAELLTCLDIVEATKDILQTDVRLEGNCLWSTVDDISFSSGINNNEFVYHATIAMTAASIDSTPSYPSS